MIAQEGVMCTQIQVVQIGKLGFAETGIVASQARVLSDIRYRKHSV
jgi:hypothetical protein